MSAFMLSNAHIDLLATAYVALVDKTADASHVARLLIEENANSVCDRYSHKVGFVRDIRNSVRDYTFEAWPGEIDPLLVSKSLACYAYQACEHAGWKFSEAREMMAALAKEVPEFIGHGPGSEKFAPFPWGVDEDARPAPQPVEPDEPSKPVEKHPTFQGLMNQAYERYQANNDEARAAREAGDETARGWSFNEFLAQLDGDEAYAVRLGNLNYQVENGGWSQWFGNDYCNSTTVGILYGVLDQIGTHSAAETSGFIREFVAALGGADVKDRDIDEDDWEAINDVSDRLSSSFYAINAELMDDAEAFFAKRAQDRAEAMSDVDKLRARLASLAASWRKGHVIPGEYHDGAYATLEACADQLDELLAESRPE